MHALTLESILWSVWPFFHGIDKGGCIPSNGCKVVSHHTKVGSVKCQSPWLYQSTYLGLLHATAITGFQNMLTLDPKDALVALVLASPGPML